VKTETTKKHTMDRIGKLYFRYGTMGSAKTALLLTTAYNFEERGMAYICFKPVVDTREDKNVIRSRIGIERACQWIYAHTDLYLVIHDIFEKVEVRPLWILVDEAQFLSEKQVDQLAAVVDDYGCNVLCYGLRTDFRTHLFEGSRRLFEIADSIEEVKSTCTCGRKTIVNARIDSKGQIVTEGEQVEIGGNDKYVAVCRKCWRNRRIESSNRFRLPFDYEDLNADTPDEE
jgi:thymidine kinase